jgi:hypothetical protein
MAEDSGVEVLSKDEELKFGEKKKSRNWEQTSTGVRVGGGTAAGWVSTLLFLL